MRCDECLPVLEEYIDGELERQRAEIVSAHLAGCSGCGAAADALRIEQEVYSRYERDLDVTPKLWTGIAARIRQDRPAEAKHAGLRERIAGILRTPRLSPAFAVLLIIIAIAVTVFVIRRGGDGSRTDPNGTAVFDQNNNSNSSSEPTPPPAPKKDPAEEHRIAGVNPAGGGEKPIAKRLKTAPQPNDLIRDAERKYEQAIAILSRDVNRRRPEMDPQTVARFELALASIDRTIAETRQAVRQQPRDPVALQYLLAAYSRKVDVLREMIAF
ncbi:MAG TPA: zf-HC2 domain-containing protein [Blastocatellia bacterium]|nr:zf-HC2 domain-containing protein [Blastocatellia bacterium]